MNTFDRMLDTVRGAAVLDRAHRGAYPGVLTRQRLRHLLREGLGGPWSATLLSDAARYRRLGSKRLARVMVESARIYRLEGLT